MNDTATIQQKYLRNDPGTWSAVIALLALVLSQFQPVSTWFPKQKVEVITPAFIGFSAGSSQAVVVLDSSLRNEGNRDFSVGEMKLELLYPNGSSQVFDRVFFIEPGPPPTMFQPAVIRLKQNEQVTRQFVFSPAVLPAEEQQLADFKTDLKKLQKAPPTEKLSKQIFELITDQVKRTQKLTQGSYSFTITIKDQQGKVVATRMGQFNLQQVQIDTIFEKIVERTGMPEYMQATMPNYLIPVRVNYK